MKFTELFPSAVLPLGSVALDEKADAMVNAGENRYLAKTGPAGAKVRIDMKSTTAMMDGIGRWWWEVDGVVVTTSWDNQVALTVYIGETIEPDWGDIGTDPAEVVMLPPDSEAVFVVEGKSAEQVFRPTLTVDIYRDEPDPVPVPDGYAILNGKIYRLTEV